MPTNYWQAASFEPPQEAQSVTSLPAESVVLPPSPPLAKGTLDEGTNEQALVLYRPVNPPVFPGGPSVGSTDLPLKVDTAAFQAACKGTGNNGSINDAGSSSAFASTSSDALSWTGLFEGSPFHFLVCRQILWGRILAQSCHLTGLTVSSHSAQIFILLQWGALCRWNLGGFCLSVIYCCLEHTRQTPDLYENPFMQE